MAQRKKRTGEKQDDREMRVTHSRETANGRSDGIDYRAEGRDQGPERRSRTDRGYDEAAHSGPSRYGALEGEGGVFGTTGGGSYGGGFQTVERPGLYDRSGEPYPTGRDAHRYGRDAGRFDQVTFREGPHRGRGPKGWTRSDARIEEDTCEMLAHEGWLDASDIVVRVEEGEVTLEGTVDTRAMKRLAEDIAWGVTGVGDVHNRLRLRR